MALPVSKTDHRKNWLLAALEPEDLACLEPHLDVVILPKGTMPHEAGDPVGYTYFPHDTIVGLINGNCRKPFSNSVWPMPSVNSGGA
jgi:hypothetical protein